MKTTSDLPPLAEYVLLPLANVTLAFLVSGLVVLMIGENPIDAVQLMIWGAFGYGEGLGYTLYYATNFIFTGLAVAVAFHAGLFNIGGEGQAYLGGLGVAVACLALDRYVPWFVIAPLAVVGAAFVGAAWAAIPAYMQATRGCHLVITTIMFNFIGSALMVYLLVDVLKPDGQMAPETRTFEAGGRLPHISSIPGFDWLGLAPLNLSIVLALIACVLVWVLIWRTCLGYEIRTFGTNQTAAIYAGISPLRIIMTAMTISGALAGLMALNEVMGASNRLNIEFVAGYGFVGIAVALMGRAHPVGVVLAAILFGALYQGGAELAFDMPAITRDMIVVIQGLVILFAGALEHMFRPTVAALFGARKSTIAA